MEILERQTREALKGRRIVKAEAEGAEDVIIPVAYDVISLQIN